ncbi:hypothetical protein GCM10017044_04000 [Kordiimonas sediminis]|uniref:Lipopolysaccharide assembly protein A domain-containing protein n=1 Tax=Kordiimonas sediminis TaxID=1735581 RepID=A0A919AML0_9PROT|nr:hypothetical protein GCM10017044_04000 [Kordiimonas sediminis]
MLTALVLVVFSVSNRSVVDIGFYPFDTLVALPVYLVLFAGIFLGLLVAASVSSYFRLRGFAQRRKAERRATELEKQVTEMSEDAHTRRAEEGHKRLEAGTGPR